MTDGGFISYLENKKVSQLVHIFLRVSHLSILSKRNFLDMLDLPTILC
jgi:hypothetical protein